MPPGLIMTLATSRMRTWELVGMLGLLLLAVAATAHAAPWRAGLDVERQEAPQAAGANAERALPGMWPNWGGGPHNDRHALAELHISPCTVQRLSVLWTTATSTSVSCTPTVFEDRVYFGDMNLGVSTGYVYSADARTGEIRWRTPVINITHESGEYVVSRTSPAMHAATRSVIVGTLTGAYVAALSMDTGDILWRTKLSTFYGAFITQSPTVVGDRVYVGVSSGEETLAAAPGYVCCVFQGSFHALDVRTGAVLWSTSMLPDNGGAPGGFSGAAVWGSSPAVDAARGRVYIATGNLYNVPESVDACRQRVGNATAAVSDCIPPDVHYDSILALDTDSGAIVWAHRLGPWDVWTVACGIPEFGIPAGPGCPPYPGPDADFGQAPMLLPGVLLRTDVSHSAPVPRVTDLVVAGQKSGWLWALDAAHDGALAWAAFVCPGGSAGGLQWGSASDGANAYVSCANSNGVNYTLGGSAGPWISGGVWAAYSLSTGALLWWTPDPANFGTNGHPDVAHPFGPVSVANGVVFATSYSGYAYALDARDGAILWSFNTGASLEGGFSVSEGRAFLGVGYYVGINSDKVLAFALPSGAEGGASA